MRKTPDEGSNVLTLSEVPSVPSEPSASVFEAMNDPMDTRRQSWTLSSMLPMNEGGDSVR